MQLTRPNRTTSHGLKPSRSSHSLHGAPVSSRQLQDIHLQGDFDECDVHLSDGEHEEDYAPQIQFNNSKLNVIRKVTSPPCTQNTMQTTIFSNETECAVIRGSPQFNQRNRQDQFMMIEEDPENEGKKSDFFQQQQFLQHQNDRPSSSLSDNFKSPTNYSTNTLRDISNRVNNMDLAYKDALMSLQKMKYSNQPNIMSNPNLIEATQNSWNQLEPKALIKKNDFLDVQINANSLQTPKGSLHQQKNSSFSRSSNQNPTGERTTTNQSRLNIDDNKSSFVLNKSHQEQYSQKLYDQCIVKQEKMYQLAEKINETRMKECTFTPKINDYGERRSLDEFLQLQKQFTEYVNEKKQIIQDHINDQENNEIQPQPIITKKSQKIMDQKRMSEIPVYARLYYLHGKTGKQNIKPNQKPTQEELEERETTFKPAIHTKSQSMIRNQKVEDILYKDAIRRSENMKKTNQEAKTLQQSASQQKFTSNQSEKILYQQFLKQYRAVINDLVNQHQEVIINDKVQKIFDLASIFEILIQLGFIKYNMTHNYNSNSTIQQSHNTTGLNSSAPFETSPIFQTEQRFVFILWSIAGGDALGGILESNLSQFLLGVLAIYYDERGMLLQHHQNSQQINQSRSSNNLITNNNNNYNKGTLNPDLQRWDHNDAGIYDQLNHSQNIVSKQSQSLMYEKFTNLVRTKSIDGSQNNSLHQNPGFSSSSVNISYNNTQSNPSQSTVFNNNNNNMIDNNNNVTSPSDRGALCLAEIELSKQLLNIEIGSFDDQGLWYLTTEDQKAIHNAFETLYRNRLAYEQLKNTKNFVDHSYHPQISEHSKVLANHFREQVLVEAATLIENNAISVRIPENGKITLSQLLVLQQKAQDINLEKLKKQKEDEKLKECSFQPTTNSNYRSLNSQMNQTTNLDQSSNNNNSFISKSNQNAVNNPNGSSSAAGIKQTEELYLMAQNKAPRRDRTPDEIEYQKHYEDCTFNPDIGVNKIKIGFTKGPVEIFAKNVEKSIERMRNAQKEKDIINNFKQRGYQVQISEEAQVSKNSINPSSTKSAANLSFFQNQNTNSTQNSSYGQREQFFPTLNPAFNDVQQGFTGGISSEGSQYSENKLFQQISAPSSVKNSINSRDKAPIKGGSSRDAKSSNEFKNNAFFKQSNPNKLNFTDFQQKKAGINSSDVIDNSYINKSPLSTTMVEKYAQGHSDAFGNFNMPNNFEGNNNFLQEIHQENQQRAPLLFVDVNLGQGKTERIIVFEGDQSQELAKQFAQLHNLDQHTQQKFQQLLDSQIAGLLSRIDQELASCDSDSCLNQSRNTRL